MDGSGDMYYEKNNLLSRTKEHIWAWALLKQFEKYSLSRLAFRVVPVDIVTLRELGKIGYLQWTFSTEWGNCRLTLLLHHFIKTGMCACSLSAVFLAVQIFTSCVIVAKFL